MEVELRPHIGRNLATGQPQRLAQYRIFVDGRSVGYVGFRTDSKVLLLERFGPIERDEIEHQVGELMQREVHSLQVPDVPEELLKPDEPEYFDDFDA